MRKKEKNEERKKAKIQRLFSEERERKKLEWAKTRGQTQAKKSGNKFLPLGCRVLSSGHIFPDWYETRQLFSLWCSSSSSTRDAGSSSSVGGTHVSELNKEKKKKKLTLGYRSVGRSRRNRDSEVILFLLILQDLVAILTTFVTQWSGRVSFYDNVWFHLMGNWSRRRLLKMLLKIVLRAVLQDSKEIAVVSRGETFFALSLFL